MKQNLGFAAANNRAIKECNSEYVALLNPDALPERDWLSNLMSAARRFPENASFGSTQLMLESPNRLDGLGDVYHCSGLAWRDGHGRVRERMNETLNPIFSPCACAALYKREILVEIGGFDEDFFCYFEDVDLGFRMRLLGHQAFHVPNAIVYHAGSASSGGQHSDFSVYHGHRNLVWTFIKNMPGPLLWSLLPLHVLMNLATLFYFFLRGQGSIIFKAKWDALKSISKMRHKRREIQRQRTASVSTIWRAFDKSLIIQK